MILKILIGFSIIITAICLSSIIGIGYVLMVLDMHIKSGK